MKTADCWAFSRHRGLTFPNIILVVSCLFLNTSHAQVRERYFYRMSSALTLGPFTASDLPLTPEGRTVLETETSALLLTGYQAFENDPADPPVLGEQILETILLNVQIPPDDTAGTSRTFRFDSITSHITSGESTYDPVFLILPGLNTNTTALSLYLARLRDSGIDAFANLETLRVRSVLFNFEIIEDPTVSAAPTIAPIALPSPTSAPVPLPTVAPVPSPTVAPIPSPTPAPQPESCGAFASQCSTSSDCCSNRCILRECRKAVDTSKVSLATGRGGAAGAAKTTGPIGRNRRQLLRTSKSLVRGQ